MREYNREITVLSNFNMVKFYLELLGKVLVSLKLRSILARGRPGIENVLWVLLFQCILFNDQKNWVLMRIFFYYLRLNEKKRDTVFSDLRLKGTYYDIT